MPFFKMYMPDFNPADQNMKDMLIMMLEKKLLKKEVITNIQPDTDYATSNLVTIHCRESANIEKIVETAVDIFYSDKMSNKPIRQTTVLLENNSAEAIQAGLIAAYGAHETNKGVVVKLNAKNKDLYDITFPSHYTQHLKAFLKNEILACYCIESTKKQKAALLDSTNKSLENTSEQELSLSAPTVEKRPKVITFSEVTTFIPPEANTEEDEVSSATQYPTLTMK